VANHSFWFCGIVLFGAILGRYFLIAGGAYWLFYAVLGESLSQRTLRLRPPKRWAIRWDIGLATSSAAIFAVSAVLVLFAYDRGWTQLYGDLKISDLWYLITSFGLVLLLQDAYFYFLHRLLHWPKLFKLMHQGHHRSGDPTPWTSFAFDPAEAVFQTLFILGVICVIPLHFMTLIAILITMTVWTVFNHLGFELCPASFSQHWLSKWLIGSTHHSIHHRKYTLHYGLYFTFWDRLLGTHDPAYDHEFDASLRTSERASKRSRCC
jgi:sterol desaturase/sphingolipid hydroxylase (fatty acid hydroxylase superfamily)